MSPALDERTAPDRASGAVLFHPVAATTTTTSTHPSSAPPLSERDFWRAVGATVLATLRSWSR